MAKTAALADHLGPDSICRLERAALKRFEEADHLKAKNRLLGAVYLYGYSAEMCLSAAYYRRAGFSPNAPIAAETRRRRMAQARQLRAPSGEPLMNSDPHPLVGWARFLDWQRKLSVPLQPRDSQRLKEAVGRAALIYKHWRPELRYKTTDVAELQLKEVRDAAFWFIENQGRL